MKHNRLFFIIFNFIFNAKDPHISEVKEPRLPVNIFLLYFYFFGVSVERKTYPANRGRLLIFAGIDNQVLVDWAFIKFLIHLCFIDNEVDIRLNFPNCVDVIIDCVYKPHFS